MVNIYVLQLENNKFYVGKTNNLTIRLEQHYNTNLRLGSAWTQKYKPIKLVEIIQNCDDFDEDIISNVNWNSHTPPRAQCMYMVNKHKL